MRKAWTDFYAARSGAAAERFVQDCANDGNIV
jgi:hypothetical protein